MPTLIATRHVSRNLKCVSCNQGAANYSGKAEIKCENLNDNVGDNRRNRRSV